MFTWEEAGLLRGMLHIVWWGVVGLVVVVILWIFQTPISAGLSAGYQRVVSTIESFHVPQWVR